MGGMAQCPEQHSLYKSYAFFFKYYQFQYKFLFTLVQAPSLPSDVHQGSIVTKTCFYPMVGLKECLIAKLDLQSDSLLSSRFSLNLI